MEKKTPAFLTEKINIVKFLIFVTIFASAFILIYEPFGGEKLWEKLIGKGYPLLYMSFLIIIGLILLIISRLILYRTQKKFTVSYVFYTFWMITEIGLITLTCTLIAWSINEKNSYFLSILPRTFYYTISILLLPYTIFWLYFSLKENEKILSRIKKEESQNSDTLPNTKDLINLTDEKGNLRLSIKLEHLYYMESANNYIYVYYENSKKELTKSTLRSSLKTIEDNFPDIGLVRCHRSYIINFKKIKVLRKDKDGLMIELDHDDIADIPISKTYVDEIVKLLSKHSI